MSDKKEDGGPAFPMQMPIDDAGNPMSASGDGNVAPRILRGGGYAGIVSIGN